MKRIIYLLLSFLLLWMAVPCAASIGTDFYESICNEECELVQTECIEDSAADALARPVRNRVRPFSPEIPYPLVSQTFIRSGRSVLTGRFTSLKRTIIGKRYLYCVYRV